MSLDVSLHCPCCDRELYSGNITHNLGKMAQEADIYIPLWKPEVVNGGRAHQITPWLRPGLSLLKNNPDHFRKFDAPNGWGTYEHLVNFVEQYLAACLKHPEAVVRVSR